MVGIWGENDLSKIAYLFHSECIPLSGESIYELECFLDYESWPDWPIPYTGGLIIPVNLGDSSRVIKGDLWAVSGIYALLLDWSPCGDCKIYVGQSKNVEERIINHASKLKNGTHDNWKLQEEFKEKGALSVLLLERIDDESKLLEKEKAWIDLVQPKDRLNIMSGDVKPELELEEEMIEPTFVEKFLTDNEEITLSIRLIFERDEAIKLVNIMQRHDISSIKELLLSLE